MRKGILLILFLTLNQIGFSQEGKYFGEEYACTEISAINHYYWIDLKKDNTFEYHIFNHDDQLKCREVKGTWKVHNDTLYLTENKRKKFFYLISKDTIKSPNKDIFHKIMTGQDDEIVNKGIDDFGLGITELVKLEKVLDGKTGLTREVILEWSNKKSCR
ncbi:hypothetical protein [Sinomicrobium weinanense]|uniref:Uncharacterized protein n=1 Tax=Sinomicrobium weinanense TaxID=2842200 RepID=A0A926Q2E8_9FLAO|nr:hypothetical protein [Sinomicrobium weinanense]MBC9796448.1 hypothetical protein [Sinomicrobium weinanense]MBU3125878.1 hypothetical protein [Sinomicrobium weinanense]